MKSCVQKQSFAGERETVSGNEDESRQRGCCDVLGDGYKNDKSRFLVPIWGHERVRDDLCVQVIVAKKFLRQFSVWTARRY